MNEEVTPRKSKKLRIMGESDGEFNSQSTDVEEEEESDTGFVDPNELAAAKARSGGRGTKQMSPASKSPAKILPPKNEKKTSSVPTKGPKRVPQADAAPKKTVRQAQPPKKAVKLDQPPKGAVKHGRPPKDAVKPDKPPKGAVKLGSPPKGTVKPDKPPKGTVKLGRPPKDATKQDPAPRAPVPKKLTKASAGSAPAVNAAPKDKKGDTAQDAPRKPKVVATAGSAPSKGSQVQAPPSEIVSRRQPPNKKNTSVRVVTVAPKILEPQANPSGDALTGKSSSLAKSVPKVVQQSAPVPNGVARKRPCPAEPAPMRCAKRSRGSLTPRSDSELTEYMSASEDP